MVSKYIWHIEGNNYVVTKIKGEKNGRVIKLHRYLMGVVDDPGVEIDHINRNTLDNRLANLRLANRSLNCFNRGLSKYNSSGTTGVYKMSGYDDKWCVQINCDGKRYYLGSYGSKEEAIAVRKAAEEKLY